MLTVTRDMVLPTAITGSYPRPLWYDATWPADRSSDARRFAVPRAVSRRGRGIINAQEAAGSTSSPTATAVSTWRSAASRGSSTRSSGSAAYRPPRHLARLDIAPRPAPRQDPVGGAGGLSARRRPREADPRAARIHRAVAGRAAADRPAREIRRDLRPRRSPHAVERALPRRQGADPRSVRHHERRVPGAGRGRLPGDPGRGAAASRPRARSPTARTPISNS